MSVLNTLGAGFSEKVYENSMAVELNEAAIPYLKQPSLNVSYKGQDVGFYIPDFIAYDKIIIEMKTVAQIGDVEYAQVLNFKGNKFKSWPYIKFQTL